MRDFLANQNGSKMAKGDSALGGMDMGSFKRIKEATQMEDHDIVERYQEFVNQFPSGVMSIAAFRELSLQVLDEQEVEAFTENVFNMFDVDKDTTLTFEEFTLATLAQQQNQNPLEKLSWLFDHVYDKNKSGHVSRRELHEILMTLLKMENIPSLSASELVNDIFNDLDLNRDGLINRREFLVATSQSEILCKILTSAADEEQRRNSHEGNNPAHATAAIAAQSVLDEQQEQQNKVKKMNRKASQRKSKKKNKKKNKPGEEEEQQQQTVESENNLKVQQKSKKKHRDQ